MTAGRSGRAKYQLCGKFDFACTETIALFGDGLFHKNQCYSLRAQFMC